MVRRIGILQFVSALDEAVAGFREGLGELGYAEGGAVVFEYRNVDGNAAELPQALAAILAKDVELIFACATPAARTAAAQSGGRPVVFTPVFDPVKAGLVGSIEAPGGHVTGVSGMVLPGDKLATLRRVLPQAKSLGVLYNPDDPNASTEAAALAPVCAQFGFTLSLLEARDGAALEAALSGGLAGLDLLIVSLDKLVDDNFDRVVAATRAARVALVAHNTPGVKRGAFCTVEAPARALGRQAAKQAYRILSGAEPGAIPVEFPTETRLVINSATAAELGITLPAGVKPDLMF